SRQLWETVTTRRQIFTGARLSASELSSRETKIGSCSQSHLTRPRGSSSAVFSSTGALQFYWSQMLIAAKRSHKRSGIFLKQPQENQESSSRLATYSFISAAVLTSSRTSDTMA